MAETMIERVARAMEPAMADVADMLISKGADRASATSLLPLEKARNAIEAMRRLTVDMVEKADEATPVEVEDMPWGEIFPIWWAAAIDAALFEGGE